VNLKGTFYCCREAAPELRKAKGAIVNIASIAGHRATGSSIVYAVSKAGVIQLTRALALALAPDVRVNSVSPGLVSTRWFRQQFGDEATEAQETTFASTTPLGVIAGPDHVAQAVMAFVENDVVTGQDVVVDGGKISAQPFPLVAARPETSTVGRGRCVSPHRLRIVVEARFRVQAGPPL
jgi:NAD(P)-dependent dehydrogenase (short-subunit alcohol dehydrogenase family)